MDFTTTLGLIVLTALSLGIAALSLASLGRSATRGRERLINAMIWVIACGSVALFLYREVFVHSRWMPVEAHVDGLLLIAALFAATMLFLESRARMKGLAAFAAPVLTLLLAWAICASWFTWHLFAIDSVWRVVHLGGVYLGMLAAAMAAIGGAMYLYVQQRLRHKTAGAGETRLPSLEAMERLIVRASAFGFALLTLGLVTGVVIVTSGPTRLGSDWWYSPKVILAAAVWALYALVMNVRHAAAFRGKRAAWLSIAGLVLVLATFGVATAMPSLAPRSPAAAPDSRQAPVDAPVDAPIHSSVAEPL